MLFAQGMQVGKYRIAREIGRGGMGVVYLAEDTTLDRQVALKVLERNLMVSDQFELRFRQEARTLARIQHPNIVYIHSLEKVEGHLAIDMPLIEGGSLSDVFTRKTIRFEALLKWTQEVLNALDSCHRDGIIHRDVKPSNILIGRDERALLSDFGLVKLLEEQQGREIRESTSSGMLLGTPSYAPPELWDGADPTPAWDVYSVGVLLYEGFCGSRPYTAATPFALFKQMMAHPVRSLLELNPAISPAMNDTVMAMLNPDPALRPQDAGAALRLLRDTPDTFNAQILDEPTVMERRPDTTQLRKPPTGARRSTIVRKHRSTASRIRLTEGMAALTLLLMAGFVLWFLRSGVPGSAVMPVAADPAAPSPYQVFDTVEASVPRRWEEHLILWPKTTGGLAGIAWENTHFWYFQEVSSDRDQVRIQGAWAGYTDESATQFRYGTLSGTGQWLSPGLQLAATLEFRDAEEGTHRTASLVFNALSESESAESYFRRLSQSDYMPAVLFNEVGPRALPWTAAFEQEVLPLAWKVLKIRRLPLGFVPITIDGKLTDAAWDALFPADANGHRGIRPQKGAVHAEFLQVLDANTLYVAVDVPFVFREPRITLLAAPRFACPDTVSPRMLLLINRTGPITGTRTRGGIAEPWQPKCEAKLSQDNGHCRAEVALPLEELGITTPPQPGTRWRVGCVIQDSANPESPKTVWGDIESPHPEDGILASFDGTPGR